MIAALKSYCSTQVYTSAGYVKKLNLDQSMMYSYIVLAMNIVDRNRKYITSIGKLTNSTFNFNDLSQIWEVCKVKIMSKVISVLNKHNVFETINNYLDAVNNDNGGKIRQFILNMIKDINYVMRAPQIRLVNLNYSLRSKEESNRIADQIQKIFKEIDNKNYDDDVYDDVSAKNIDYNVRGRSDGTSSFNHENSTTNKKYVSKLTNASVPKNITKIVGLTDSDISKNTSNELSITKVPQLTQMKPEINKHQTGDLNNQSINSITPLTSCHEKTNEVINEVVIDKEVHQLHQMLKQDDSSYANQQINEFSNAQTLYIIIVYSNPCKFSRRRELFEITFNQLNEHKIYMSTRPLLRQLYDLEIVTSQIAYGSEEYVYFDKYKPSVYDCKNRVGVNDVFWSKENMINIAINNIIKKNPNATKFAFVDADIYFLSKTFVEDTINKLTPNSFVQMFDTAEFETYDGKVFNGFGYMYVRNGRDSSKCQGG